MFTRGKGGVGKTSMAATIVFGLATKGVMVHLTTTDPAAHLENVIHAQSRITMSHIDEKEELNKYREHVLEKARANQLSEDDIAYIEEDLRSPCTQEIAVFRAFANIVARAEKEVVVIDTAPTGHTLLLLDSTLSYNTVLTTTNQDTKEWTEILLPRSQNRYETDGNIVTLPESTQFFEDLH